MAMTKAEMDALVAEHFGYEAADDLDGVLGTLAPDAEHEVIPSPLGATRTPAARRAYYELLFRSLEGERVEPLSRYYGDGFLVDESLWHGRVVAGRRFSARVDRAVSASGSCTSSS